MSNTVWAWLGLIFVIAAVLLVGGWELNALEGVR